MATLAQLRARPLLLRCRDQPSRRHSARLGFRLLSSAASEDGPSKPPSSSDYRTNAGTIDGVWVFHRHGDRTPTRSLVADHRLVDEAEFWRTKIPSPDDDDGPYSKLSEVFPPDIHPSNNDGEFLDVHRAPFGFLTWKGMEQMRTVGRRFQLRYDAYGHKGGGGGDSFLDHWDVTAYSTNYLRTVMSVQCFLDGLFGTRAVGHDGSVCAAGETPLVPVRVRDRNSDTLNAFDRRPDRMLNLVSDVVSTAHFEEHDGRAAPLAARLANFLPGLAKPGHRAFGGPSGINWIHASDHFVCRSSHDLPYAAYSRFESDGRTEETMAAMAHQIVAHLAWRFRMWYTSPPLLSSIAGPPLREIATQIQSTPSLGVEERRPFVIYSCHDVTILGLLYGIGADFLAPVDDVENEEYNIIPRAPSSWRFWPGYASTLVFELVRVRPGFAGPDSHVVRVLLNGRPVRVVSMLRKQQKIKEWKEERRKRRRKGWEIDGSALGGFASWDDSEVPIGKDASREGDHGFDGDARLLSTGGMLTVPDFLNLVSELESAGGNKNKPPELEDSDAKRDITGWTG